MRARHTGSWLLVLAAALLLSPIAAAQNYQFGAPFLNIQGESESPPGIGITFSNGCDVPCPAGTFGFNIFANGARQNGKVSLTSPATAPGARLPDGRIQLGAASFQVAWSNVGAFSSVQVMNRGDAGVGACSPGGGGGSCVTNGLVSVPVGQGLQSIYLNMSVIVNTIAGGQPATVTYKVTWIWQITPAAQGSVKIDHVEVTQSIQDSAGTAVPYIAGKTTLIRVFVKSTTKNSVNGVQGTVSGALPDSNNVIFVAYPADQQLPRDKLPSSLNFQLAIPPPAGAFTFSVDVTAPNGDSDHADKTVTFVRPASSPAKFYIASLPVCIHTNTIGDSICPRDNLDPAVESYASDAFPFSDDTFQYFTVPVPNPPLINGTIGGQDLPFPAFDLKVSLKLFKYFILLNMFPLPNVPRIDHLTGLLDSYSRSATGPSRLWYEDFAASGSSRKISWETDTFAHIDFAHQLGHQFGLADNNGATGEVGFRRIDSLPTVPFVFTPASLLELMNPQAIGYSWISTASYNGILAGVPAIVPASTEPLDSTATAASPAAAPSEFVVVSGTVQRDGSAAQIDPVYHITTAQPQVPSQTNGNHCLQFSNVGGVLGQYCFDLNVSATVAGLDQQIFAVSAPWPAGTTKLALMRGSKQVASMTSSQDPVVTILSPKTGDRWQGTNTITWSTAGAPASTTMYTVYYSSDAGTTWVPLVSDIPDSSYTFDAAQILGGSQVLFRVMAASGLNSGSATVGPIQVTQAPKIGATASVVDFGNVLVKESIPRNIGITSTGSGPLTISSISVGNPAFMVFSRAPAGPVLVGKTFRISLLLIAPASGKQTGTLTVKSNDPVTPVFSIPLTGLASTTPAPSIVAPTAALEFGNVPVSQSADLVVTIANSGSADLNVTAVTSSDSQFTVVGPAVPFTISASGTTDVTLRFKPSGLGPRSANITVASNDPTHGSITVSARGTGVAASATPQISTGGVVNAASYQGTIARGALASIFGSNLATGTASATSLPLAKSLAGTQVTVGGIPAPLVYVSPAQINFQVPLEISGTSAAIAVISNNATSPLASAPLADYSVGVFAYARTASNLDPIIVHGLTNQLITPTSPAAPNEVVVVYATGIGKLSNPPRSGEAAPFNPLSTSVDLPTITLGGAPVTVLFAGLTPGYVGLVQINIQLPSSLPPGSSLPLAIQFPGSPSPVVNLAVQSGAGSQPKLALSTNSLAFGTVTVNQTKDLSVTVTNTGSGTISATVKPPGSGFNLLSATSFTLGAGQSASVNLRFAPFSAGPFNSTVVITSNDPASPATITLSGTGQTAGSSDVVLKVDGGGFDATVGYPSGTATAYFVNRLTPPSYPATLKSVQIFFSTRPDGLALNTPVTVISATNPSGSPSLSTASAGTIDLTSSKLSSLDQFVTYTVPARTITSGDFVVGFVVQNPANVYPADLDQITASQQRSYVSSNGLTFTLLDTISPDVAGNLAVRAVVTLGSAGNNPESTLK
ncbi:MAG: choice-of-anchor D domain-containing protein [Acidobacteriota bacterium]|nr:choice-of-anchor D domain-containing protein [Acidobacteriota bacterium]